MDKRQQLASMVKLFILFGLVAISIPFVQSLLPSRGAGSDLPHLYIGDMSQCSYRIEQSASKSAVGTSWLIFRNSQGEFRLFRLPTDEGRILLPDHAWHRYAGRCENFRPELEYERVKPNGVIACHDKGLEGAERWRWDYTGKSLVPDMPDLPKQRFVREGDHLVVGKKAN